jgi:myo-inositol-1(or 4)-monophosphatase
LTYRNHCPWACGGTTIEAETVRTARDIAEAAGRHLMTFFRTGLEARAKTKTSFVTEADETTELMIREALGKAFPGEPVLGEEFGLETDPDGAWWVIDPIDGTSNFVSGLAIFCVSMARMKQGRPVLAVTHDPVRGETYHAARGEGAFLNEDRISVDAADRGGLTMLSIRHSLIRRDPELVSRLPTDKLRSLGSACLDLAYIAAGRMHGMVARRINLWDIAAGALLVEEAGGVVHSDGRRPLFPLDRIPRDYTDFKVPLIAGAPIAVEMLERLVELG